MNVKQEEFGPITAYHMGHIAVKANTYLTEEGLEKLRVDISFYRDLVARQLVVQLKALLASGDLTEYKVHHKLVQHPPTHATWWDMLKDQINAKFGLTGWWKLRVNYNPPVTEMVEMMVPTKLAVCPHVASGPSNTYLHMAHLFPSSCSTPEQRMAADLARANSAIRWVLRPPAGVGLATAMTRLEEYARERGIVRD